eukprot:1152662-Pelagomonas_calceolata.AAC.4
MGPGLQQMKGKGIGDKLVPAYSKRSKCSTWVLGCSTCSKEVLYNFCCKWGHWVVRNAFMLLVSWHCYAA